ncbi:MAG: RNA pseudouridine synthase [Rhodothermales bacterium]
MLDPASILYVDNHVLVVEKPAGVLSQGDATGDLDLLTMAKAYVKVRFEKPGEVFLGLVHRLDRPVSGVMVFARTSKAASRLAAQFKTRAIGKRYVALVEGRCAGEGTQVDYLWKDHLRVRSVGPNHPKGMQSELSWKAVRQRDGMTVLDVQPKSGRPHQIRVQLAEMGHPIVGDFKYGARQPFDGRNLALHSYQLAFDHPTREERCVFAAPPPATWPAWARERIVDDLLA